MEKVKSIKFNYDGQDCKIKLMYRGQTTIALIVIGKEDMTYKDRCDRVYCGAATCHPNDTYDVNMGIKQACRSALSINEYNDYQQPRSEEDIRSAAIYRAIRTALNPRTVKRKWAIVLETTLEEADVFDKLPAVLPGESQTA